MIPERIVSRVGYACVKIGFRQIPAAGRTDPFSQSLRVIIGIGVTKSFLGGLEEVLPVDESDGPLNGGLGRHACGP